MSTYFDTVFLMSLFLLTNIIVDPDVTPPEPTAEPQYQGTAQLARFGWEMNPLRKNPGGPSDVSFTLTITPHPSTDVISGNGLWRVGVFGSERDGDEPGEIYQRQVTNIHYKYAFIFPN